MTAPLVELGSREGVKNIRCQLMGYRCDIDVLSRQFDVCNAMHTVSQSSYHYHHYAFNTFNEYSAEQLTNKYSEILFF